MAEQKGQPFSVRFSKRIDQFMELEAKRLKRSKSSLVEELATEAATQRRFPGSLSGGRGRSASRGFWERGSTSGSCAR